MNLFRELIERIGNALRSIFRGAHEDAREESLQSIPDFAGTRTLRSPRQIRVQENYLHTLEDDVARLRAENRALLNSLLGTAGIPPLEIPGGDGATRPAAMPTRRRSWPQIAHSLETLSRDAASARGAQPTGKKLSS
jgi:hypothetical protein